VSLTTFIFSLYDAMDVDHEADYKEMVMKIQESTVTLTKVFVDMKDVEKLATTLASSGGPDDEEGEDDDG
jgi:hypothetical protein